MFIFCPIGLELSSELSRAPGSSEYPLQLERVLIVKEVSRIESPQHSPGQIRTEREEDTEVSLSLTFLDLQTKLT